MTFQQKSRAMIQVIRPELPAVAGLCVNVGQAIALGKLPSLSMGALGFLLGFWLSGSAMVFNDYFDLEVDRINTPERPFPAGLLSRKEMILLGGASAVIGLGLALYIHPIVFVLGLVTWMLGFLYNWRLKAAGLWGNLIVSFSVAMTILLGGFAVEKASNPMLWVFALMTGLFDLAEEIAGDAMDMEGDRKRASKSIALVYGKKNALRVSSLLLGVVVILTVFPVFQVQTGWGYLIPITIMDILIILFAYRLFHSQSPRAGREAMRALYLSAACGLVAFILGTFMR